MLNMYYSSYLIVCLNLWFQFLISNVTIVSKDSPRYKKFVHKLSRVISVCTTSYHVHEIFSCALHHFMYTISFHGDEIMAYDKKD